MRRVILQDAGWSVVPGVRYVVYLREEGLNVDFLHKQKIVRGIVGAGTREIEEEATLGSLKHGPQDYRECLRRSSIISSLPSTLERPRTFYRRRINQNKTYNTLLISPIVRFTNCWDALSQENKSQTKHTTRCLSRR
ncbi:hypothetical protein RRG08_037986 [Elysia crispata]|uniref:Uncharacterized protein n=1 Tax=Elysia crispata TaxID=231223 RepID=A0AAE1ABW2_9GAST|nr:hypothetical protein RRG08_037986 [Elysia crispata]